MSTTTEILFNSPALHSLKRDQLVRLCKLHSIKASGKNVDLIDRLKQHAETLPRDSPLNIASRSEYDEKENIYRPSEQWEVMDSIPEAREDTVSTKSGDFGTDSSKTMSSIKALASSLGFKRSTSVKSVLASSSSVPSLPATDELTQYSTPYSSLPISDPPQTDNFTFDPTPTLLRKFDFSNPEDTAPLPGHMLRTGVPAPHDARLSMGLTPATPGGKSGNGPTTTLRLVSNPVPPKPEATEPSTPQLKPFETNFDLIMGSPSNMPPSWPEPTHPPAPSTPSQPVEKPEMFIFGSPIHRATDFQFRIAAADVLDEMNRRLKEGGIQSVDSSLIDNIHKGGTVEVDRHTEREIKPLPRSSLGKDVLGVRGKFEKMHEQQFRKMEGIEGFVNRRAGNTSSKAQVSDDVKAGMKRKSNVLADDDGNPRRPTGTSSTKTAETRVISNGRRKLAAMVPGSFPNDGDSDSEERGNKRPRVDFTDHDKTVEDEANKASRDREAMRRKLEINKARRRSSAARVSMGRAGVLHKQKPAAKPSRFGFLSSAAKSFVRGVWGSRADAVPVSSNPKSAPVVQPAKASSSTVTSSTAVGKASTGTIPSLRPPSKAIGTINSTSSAHSRSPIPSFTSNTRYSTMRTSTVGTTATRNNSVISRNTSGSKTASSRVSSLGARTSGQTSRNVSQSSSRLLAPTASSLAKTSGHRQSGTAKTISNESKTVISTTLVVPSGSKLPSPIRPSVPSDSIGQASSNVIRQKSIARKPRISRSKVIAKLATQRAATTGGSHLHAARVRSSLGAKASRKSVAIGTKGDSAIVLSAKKKARQSEYLRRKSRIGSQQV